MDLKISIKEIEARGEKLEDVVLKKFIIGLIASPYVTTRIIITD